MELLNVTKQSGLKMLHRAQFMAKAIYRIKIFLFRDEFQVSIKERISVDEICQFVVKVYLQAWFTAPAVQHHTRPRITTHNSQNLSSIMKPSTNAYQKLHYQKSKIILVFIA